MKRCSKCKEFKDEDKFGKDSGRKDGLNYVCKPCRISTGKEYRINNTMKHVFQWNQKQFLHLHWKGGGTKGV